MYFLRLAMLKPVVEEIAAEAWADLEVCLTELLAISIFLSYGLPR